MDKEEIKKIANKTATTSEYAAKVNQIPDQFLACVSGFSNHLAITNPAIILPKTAPTPFVISIKTPWESSITA